MQTSWTPCVPFFRILKDHEGLDRGKGGLRRRSPTCLVQHASCANQESIPGVTQPRVLRLPRSRANVQSVGNIRRLSTLLRHHSASIVSKAWKTITSAPNAEGAGCTGYTRYEILFLASVLIGMGCILCWWIGLARALAALVRLDRCRRNCAGVLSTECSIFGISS